MTSQGLQSKVVDSRMRWRLAHPEKHKQVQRENKRRFRIKNPLVALVRSVKQRAKKRGLEFNITSSDLHLPEICPVLKVPFDLRSKQYTYSVDRIDCSKGYIKGNVRIISNKANRLKSDLTVEECKLILNDLQANL